MRFRGLIFRVTILLLLILLSILGLKYRVETYDLSAKVVRDTLDKFQEIETDTLEIVPKDTINTDSVANFALQLDSILAIFQQKHKIQLRKKTTSSNLKFDPNKKLILLTGDSMGDLFFFALRKLRKANDFEIVYKPDYGSQISEWARTKRLVGYIKKYQPDFVIFTLGSNEILWGVSKKKIRNMHTILSHLKGVEYVWVGPPNWKKDKGLDSILHKNVGDAHYFVSKDFDFKRRSDGAHPTMPEGEIWTDTLVRWINQNPIYSLNFSELPPRRGADFERLCRKN